ncbi:hypothetical protein FRC01_004502 [Tulasnella sp. 417]|nr:hypothetical protein FRC01_004502 [Tulasnella sp. 417]
MSPARFKGNQTSMSDMAPQQAPIMFEHLQHGGDLTVCQVIHAVLKASGAGGLTKKEIVSVIRVVYPGRGFAESTVSHCLSRSRDFRKMKSQGKTRGRWVLTGTCNGVQKGATTDSRTPTRFDRISTPITHDYIKSGAGHFTIRNACHAVLNASAEGSLTTDEIEVIIRTYYDNKQFARSTLDSTLSRLEDFSQVFLYGKAPGRWFLSGTMTGINWTNAIQKTGSRGTPDPALSSDAARVATGEDTPPTADLPYNSKTEEVEAHYFPDLAPPAQTFSSSLLSSGSLGSDHPPRTDGAVGPFRGTGGPTPRYQPYPVTKTPKKRKYADLGIQLGTTVPLPNTTSSFDHYNCNTEELAVKFDALQLSPPLPAPTSQQLLDVPLALPHAPASFGSWSLNEAETYGLAAPYQGDLGSNNADHTSYWESFSDGSSPVPILLQDLADVNGNMTPKTGYSIMMTEQQIAHNEWPQVAGQAYEEVYTARLESYPHALILGDKNPFDQNLSHPDVYGAGFPLEITFGYQQWVLHN